MRASRIAKIAGLSLAGFVAASVAADKASLTPLMSQVAGFAGAFFGTLAVKRKSRQAEKPDEKRIAATASSKDDA